MTVPAADNVIRLLPPLNISDDDIATAVNLLDASRASRFFRVRNMLGVWGLAPSLGQKRKDDMTHFLDIHTTAAIRIAGHHRPRRAA